MDSIAILMLMHISGFGHTTINRLLYKMKGLELTPGALLDLSPQDISHQFGLRPDIAEEFFTHRDQAQQTSEQLEQHEIRPADRSQIPLERIHDHEMRFLSYEGPVNAGKGSVVRVEAGVYSREADLITFSGDGAFSGSYRFEEACGQALLCPLA